MLIQESQIQVLGFDFIKELYKDDAYFREAFEACQNPILMDNNKWMEYFFTSRIMFQETPFVYTKLFHERQFDQG